MRRTHCMAEREDQVHPDPRDSHSPDESAHTSPGAASDHQETAGALPEDAPGTRRKLLGILGITFLTAGFAKAASPVVPRARCGAPHGSGVGYQEDYSCDESDNDCGKVTSNPSFGGRGGASYHDNDCKPSATTATDGQDNDCGKLQAWGLGGQRDDDCGKAQGDGTFAQDQDCNVHNRQIPNGGWQDQDCGKVQTVGEPSAVHKDSNPGYDDDEDCTFWDSNCTWFDGRVKPKRGDDPDCIHLDQD